jgi:hypothetical protein
VLVLAAVLLPLADPRRVLMVRDLAFFHLPLRTAVADLVGAGELPEWNRFIHGGQPILSNPNYAAFYPPSWLALVLSPRYALNVLVLLHAGWALAGAWRLLRRLGAAPEAAALGAMGFAGSSWFLSLTSTFNFYCSMAWFPWVLVAAEGAFAASRHARWAGAALLAAVALAMQLFAGEPVAVLVSCLAVAALATGAGQRLRRTLPRLLSIALLAAALGAVQLLPTIDRVAGTVRGGGLGSADADRWSTPPQRLVDFVLPRFWGDSGRDEAGLWFGWNLHDQDFPYVVALYSGLLLTTLAAAALLRWPIPYRGAWLFAAIAGVLLALGRHGPVWGALRTLPVLSFVRYPEKFLVLTAAVVPIAGALGWQHLLDARDRGERRWTFLPAALAGIVAAVAALFAAVLTGFPAVGELFVRRHSGLPPSPRTLAAAVAFLQREALVALFVSLLVTALLALLAGRRFDRRRVAVGALLLLAADLWWYGRGLAPTLPAELALVRPPAVAVAQAVGGRLFSGPAIDRRPEIGMRRGPAGFQQLWARLQRLDPYAATLWRIEYALDRDYDLMLTRWARHAQSQLLAAWPRRGEVDRLLAAWDVGALVLRRDTGELLRELRRTRRPPADHVVLPLRGRLPRFRFVRALAQAADEEAASLALAGLDLAREDFCVGRQAVPAGASARGTLLSVQEGQRVRLRYHASGPAFLVAAITFDDGWQATLEDGTVAATCPTALGQLGVALPAGEHALRLRYRDPWVRVGAAATVITLLAAALHLLRRRGGHRETGATATVELPP